ncbi:hypothetical protein FBZ83_1282 [Azospirillum brasilense]|uniref:N-acetyltransferase domain-containing protein n=1 Tax=Azospirillum brasilense TaxID=192 RepID=A0A560BM87_AZOBR|nr:hypothetical protein [Azospirillum brasilense]TWA73728.1 hypothetical protein FBZ83_1282 [Azospirillum brasilense]
MDGAIITTDQRAMGTIPWGRRHGVRGADRRLVETLPLGCGALASALVRARDALCASLLARGVTLVLSESWDELQRLNLCHRAGWFPLLPRPASAPAFWIGAIDDEGAVVATHGVVMLDCHGTSFGARVADLSAFHDAETAPAEEWCFVASEAAYDTRGAVAWIVAGWTRPDWRGRGLFHDLGAMARLVALATGNLRWVVGLVDPETVPVWRGRAAGWKELEPRPGVLYHQAGVGRLPLHVMRWSRAAVLLDLTK